MTLSNKINTLNVNYINKTSAFYQLRDKEKSVLIQNLNLQTLAIEMFKVSKRLTVYILAHCMHF